MKTNKFNEYIGISIGVIICLFLLISPLYIFVKAAKQDKRENDVYLSYHNEHQTVYEITYTDGFKDTLKVYDDKINVFPHSDFFGKAYGTYLEYIPFKRYDSMKELAPIHNVRIENIIRCRKLK